MSEAESSDLGIVPLPHISSSEPDSPPRSILKPPSLPRRTLSLEENPDAHEEEISASEGPAHLPPPAPLTREEEARLSVSRERMRLQAMAMESPTEEMLAMRKPKKNLSALISMASPEVDSSRSRVNANNKANSSKPGDWNKENLPLPGSKSGNDANSGFARPHDGGTPKSSLYKSKSVGNIMKRPLEPLENNVFRIRRRPSLFGAGAKRSISVDDEAQSPKLQKANDGTPTVPPTAASVSGTPTSSTTQRMASLPVVAAPKFSRSFSETHAAVIKRACKLAEKPNLTADMRQELALPTMSTGKKHQDLNTIDCHAMARLIRGEYSDVVSSYRVIDARYVYEFQGGHIVGAENFGAWDEQAFFDEFLPERMGAKSIEGLTHLASIAEEKEEEEEAVSNQQQPGTSSSSNAKEKRSIIIFHCEFSSQRGPALMKELRKKDRTVNHNSYPALHYPEMYLLHNGYKEFWENYPDLCEPRGYQMMKDPTYHAEEKMFRKKSKSWAAGGGGGTVARTGASASRLFKF